MPEPASDPAAVPTLDYGRRSPLALVSRHRNRLILLALLIAAGIPLYRNWPALKHRALWLYWSRQAATHVMPVDTDGGMAATYVPDEYVELRKVDPRVRLTGRSDGPVIFMGTRWRPDGTPRLVIIAGTAGNSRNLMGSSGVVVLPVPRWGDSAPPTSVTPMFTGSNFGGIPPYAAKFGMGRADASDPSRIIIPYSILQKYAPSVSLPMGPPPSDDGEITLQLANDDSLHASIISGSGSLSRTRLTGDPAVLDAEGRRPRIFWSAP